MRNVMTTNFKCQSITKNSDGKAGFEGSKGDVEIEITKDGIDLTFNFGVGSTMKSTTTYRIFAAARALGAAIDPKRQERLARQRETQAKLREQRKLASPEVKDKLAKLRKLARPVTPMEAAVADAPPAAVMALQAVRSAPEAAAGFSVVAPLEAAFNAGAVNAVTGEPAPVPQPLPYEPKASKRHAKVEAKPADLDDAARTFAVIDDVEGTTSVAVTNPNAPGSGRVQGSDRRGGRKAQFDARRAIVVESPTAIKCLIEKAL
jgi:hypothetical protein